jgi:hypothetical protein
MCDTISATPYRTKPAGTRGQLREGKRLQVPIFQYLRFEHTGYIKLTYCLNYYHDFTTTGKYTNASVLTPEQTDRRSAHEQAWG